MIRRSLRIGIRLGVLAGLAYAMFKIVQARQPLPAVPSGDDPWAPSRAPAPSPAPAPTAAPAPARPAPSTGAPGPAEPALVEPTMLHSTSLKRPATGTGDRSFDPASSAPPVVPPASPFAPSAAPAPTLVPPTTTEIEPDDDEIVILTTGDNTVAPTPGSPAVEVDPEVPEPPGAAGEAPADKAAADKMVAKAASPRKAPARKASPRKGAARKAPAKKAPAKKAPAKKAPAKKAGSSSAQAWVEPEGDVCPTTHPVKAKLRSAIFHLPGMAAYGRTSPDRCYRDEEAATADGLRKAAR